MPSVPAERHDCGVGATGMNHLAFVDALQKANSDSVAFYPKVALERGFEAGLVDISFENGQPAGYLYRSKPAPGREVRIWQAVIDYDIRRRGYGAELVAKLVQEAQVTGSIAVQLRCRSSIEGNIFWQALGFECVDVRPGGKKRGADLNIWRLDLHPTLLTITADPSSKAEDQTEYRHLKAAGFEFPSRFALGGSR